MNFRRESLDIIKVNWAYKFNKFLYETDFQYKLRNNSNKAKVKDFELLCVFAEIETIFY